MVPEDVPEDGEHAQEPEHVTVADARVSELRRPFGKTASELVLSNVTGMLWLPCAFPSSTPPNTRASMDETVTLANSVHPKHV